MVHLVLTDLAYPHVVLVQVLLKNVHRGVWLAREAKHGSVGPVPHVHRAFICRLTATNRLRSLERMYVVLEDSHHSVFVKKGHPVKERIKEPLRIFVKALAGTVNRYMIVHKFDLLLIGLEGVLDELFLDSIKPMKIPAIQDCIAYLRPLEVQEASPILDFRHSIYDASSCITFELLREVLEESSGVEGDIDSR